MKHFTFVLLLLVTQSTFAADSVKFSRRSLLIGSGAALITKAVPRAAITTPVPKGYILVPSYDMMSINDIPTWPQDILDLLNTGTSERQSLESKNLEVPKNLNAGWNSVAFSGPQLSPVPGLVRVLSRSLFDAFRAHVQQGKIQSPKQAILAIEKMEETPCSPELTPQPEQVTTVLIIEDGKDE